MDFKKQFLKELKEDRGFVIELQRVLNIDDLEDKVDEINNLSQT